ncbi:FHA domain-containing protein [Telluria beijingensis]|uniref:FHA domain-containing protein n=1 Tax=Telluria beijingensis TaxID=3068633 RepID=UPI002795DEA7|nr:FHA domain-containing protein [Massilia sp. REN29]
MNRCRNPAHPHCTVWVLPGDAMCAHGHAQPADEAVAAPAPVMASAVAGLPSSFDAITALRSRRNTEIRPVATDRVVHLQRPQLHISGFDPRAAGGRQAIRLELRGMPMDCAPEVRMLVRSALRLHGGESYGFQRTSRGDWRPLFLEFSSRGLEHGQYRIEIELHSRHPQAPDASRTWTCSPVILVPRQDASLGEIHQTFLATHKNVRVTADDAGIARVNAPGGGRIDIDVTARNASIAQLNLDGGGSGKIDLGMSTIAWDEDLIEIDLPAPAAHPCPATGACLVHAEADSATQRHVRLFALDECVLGRFEPIAPEAELLLAHHGEAGMEYGGLTRRLSGRHAVIRRSRHGFEIEDVSRYGLLLDGVWPGKHMPVQLRLGMRIDLTASIKGIVTLEVTALMAHAVVLHRLDAGARAECFYLMAPDCLPAPSKAAGMPRAATLPLLFHRDGGFWQVDRASGRETPLAPESGLDRLPQTGLGIAARFVAQAYPEAHGGPRGSDERRSFLPSPAFSA